MKNKKEKGKPEQVSDKAIHRSFQLGALILIVYTVYNIYFEGNAGSSHKSELKNLSDQQLDERINTALKKATDTPEYKNVKDFSDYFEANFNKQESKALKTPEGVLIFIPALQLEKSNKVEVRDGETDFIINTGKLPRTEPEVTGEDKKTPVPVNNNPETSQ
jgi:hypothetical protein